MNIIFSIPSLSCHAILPAFELYLCVFLFLSLFFPIPRIFNQIIAGIMNMGEVYIKPAMAAM